MKPEPGNSPKIGLLVLYRGRWLCRGTGYRHCLGTPASTYDKYGRRVGQQITELQHDFTIKLTYRTTKLPSCSFKCSFLEAINIDLYFPHVFISRNLGNSDHPVTQQWVVLSSGHLLLLTTLPFVITQNYDWPVIHVDLLTVYPVLSPTSKACLSPSAQRVFTIEEEVAHSGLLEFPGWQTRS